LKQEITGKPEIIQTYIANVCTNYLYISDDCLLACLKVIAKTSKDSEVVCQAVLEYPEGLERLSKHIRHPDNKLKVQVARVLTNLN